MPSGRSPKNVEFINVLKEISGITSTSDFATACGKHQSNMSNYLNGTTTPGRSALRSCLTELYSATFSPLMEVEPVPTNLNKLPTVPGVYIIYDSAANVLYIGQAASFRTEIRQTFNRNVPVPIRAGPTLNKAKPKIRDLAASLSLYQIDDATLRHNIEALLLRVFVNQTHNSNIGKFK